MHRWYVKGNQEKKALQILKDIAEYQIRILNEAQYITNRIGMANDWISYFCYEKTMLQ